MKKENCLIVLMLLLSIAITQPTHAKIWRVNLLSNYNGTTLWGDNFGGTASNPVFKQLKQPNDSSFVLAGDTIHVEGAVDVYDAVDITKELIIIGPGYFLLYNPNTSSNMLEAKIRSVRFTSSTSRSSNSSRSKLVGIHLTNGGVTVSEQNNITIKRCQIDDYINLSGFPSYDIFIQENFFPTGNFSIITESVDGLPPNCKFNNNICQRQLIVNYNPASTFQECNNNIFEHTGTPAIDILASSFKNNILNTPAAAVSINHGAASSLVSNNISTSSTNQLGTANNNQVVDQPSLFITSTSPDGKYQLKPGSPAIGAGIGGIDCGVFGNAAPTNKYTLSGLPPIPVIYDISTSGVADATGLPVTIKARTIK